MSIWRDGRAALGKRSTVPPLDERSIHGLLAGLAVPGHQDVAAAVAAVAAVGRGPAPVPSGRLEHVLAEGLPPAAAARAATPRRAGRTWVARVAVGLGATLAATMTATANALPAPLQEVVADTVRALTPFQLPRPSDDTPVDDRSSEQRGAGDGGPEAERGAGGAAAPDGEPSARTPDLLSPPALGAGRAETGQSPASHGDQEPGAAGDPELRADMQPEGSGPVDLPADRGVVRPDDLGARADDPDSGDPRVPQPADAPPGSSAADGEPDEPADERDGSLDAAEESGDEDHEEAGEEEEEDDSEDDDSDDEDDDSDE